MSENIAGDILDAMNYLIAQTGDRVEVFLFGTKIMAELDEATEKRFGVKADPERAVRQFKGVFIIPTRFGPPNTATAFYRDPDGELVHIEMVDEATFQDMAMEHGWK